MRLRFRDVLRLAAIAAVSFALSYKLPMHAKESSVTSVFNLLFVFSFLAGYFINRALDRRKTVTNAVEVELARLRRLWNLSARMSDTVWCAKVREALKTYHVAVGRNLFAYHDALGDYRMVSEAVYDYEPNGRKDEMLFSDMLATTRDIALERRPMERALETRIPGYSWAVILLIVAGIIALLLVNRGQGMTPFSVGATTAGLLAVLDLLWHTDSFTKAEIRKFEQLYRDNIPHE